MLLNAYCTHRNPPALEFPHQLVNRRDRSDPELSEHINGFIGFVMGGGSRQMNTTRFHVLGHLGRVRHHLALEVEGEHMDAFAAWAARANAIVFTADATVRAPNGAVLVHPESGDAAPGADVPYLPDAIERKARIDRYLADLGIPVARTLPPVVSEAEVEGRDLREIAQRCLALFACALRAESIASKRSIPVKDLEAKIPIGFAALSPRERAFMNEAKPSQQDVVDYAWRYEALAVLAWSVGAVPELPFPKGTCDVPALAQAMFDVMDKPFAPKPVTLPTLLDALDLHYRLHWATTDARMNERPSPKGVEPGVVAERHHALNWLTRFQDADWDDVDTPT